MRNHFALVLGILFMFAGAGQAQEVKTIQVSAKQATCYQGKTSALARVLSDLQDRAESICTEAGKNSVLQDVTDTLKINLNPQLPGLCGGVSAQLKIDCLVLQ